MAAGAGRVVVALAVGLLLNLLADNGLGGENRSDIAVFSALSAFLIYIAGILLIYVEVLTR